MTGVGALFKRLQVGKARREALSRWLKATIRAEGIGNRLPLRLTVWNLGWNFMANHQFTFSSQVITLRAITGTVVQADEAARRGELSILCGEGEPVALPSPRLDVSPGDRISCVSMTQGTGAALTTHVYNHDKQTWHELADNLGEAIPYPIPSVAFTFLVSTLLAAWSVFEPLKVPVWQGFGLLILTTVFWVGFSFFRFRRIRKAGVLVRLKEEIENLQPAGL